MTFVPRLRALWVLSVALFLASIGFAQTPKLQAPKPKYPNYPSEMPSTFKPVTASFDHERRTVMIPMRDKVKLYTVILVPKGAKKAPILLTRTPYNAKNLTAHSASNRLGPNLYGYDNATDVIVEGGYIRVVQDIRGKHNSEGDYVMNRPLSGPQNPTLVDHSTDTYDTIDWLVKNVPETNGRVGIMGISYNGFLPLMALVNPHPALKVAVPMNPMVDGWIGDDWFQNGAFRQTMAGFIYEQQGTRDNEAKFWRSHFDDYDLFMEAGSAGELGRRYGLEQLGFWRKLLEHPTYDAYWRDQAVDKILAKQPLKVPVMIVHSLWDQEDIYGAIAVYKAIKPKDPENQNVFLFIGPWNHGQAIWDGSALGAIKFGSDTALYFRELLGPFLNNYLQEGKPGQTPGEVLLELVIPPPVIAFETGTNRWLSLPGWPAGCPADEKCSIKPTPLYLGAGGNVGFTPATAGGEAFTEYVSDPARPVPYIRRPIVPSSHDQSKGWKEWLVSDQREWSGRPDVAVFVSDVLKEPVKIAGEPIANLVASTSGTDSDWVVKLIDVYPDQVAGDPAMGGYQLMVSGEIFRGRYRESLETPKALEPGKPLTYKFELPTVNHVFLPGHRIMVQVQSSWFPLYDRNPQTFVPSIFWAKPEDYKKATQRIHHAPTESSFIELPLVTSP
ncbi:MAG: CocE/NonD family hydrolase [Thermoanaerobaculia bacterium]